MTPDIVVPAIITGVLSGAALLLPTLAIAIAYEHGRYVPMWLPDLGLAGAYTVHALWTAGLPGALSAIVAFPVTIFLALVIHRMLIARFLSSKDYLSPLLIGLGLSQMFQALASLYGHGMSQHYPKNFWASQFFSGRLGAAIYWVDIAFIVATFVAVALLYAYLRFTNWGTKVRMAIANPNDARKLALPVATIDAIVLGTAAVLMTAGTVMRGIRFDLQPAMMFYPGLSAIAACIVAKPGHRIVALVVVVVLEIMASTVGAIAAYSTLQRAVPFAVLLAVLLLRGVVLPRIGGPFATRPRPQQAADLL